MAAIPESEIAVSHDDDFGHKVFVGNLSFQTNEEELAQFFASAGNVLKANIITRGTRSLGYGFVSFETLAEAESATQQLDKKELGGRDINVEVAKPKEVTKHKEAAKPKEVSKRNEDQAGEASGERRDRWRNPARGFGRGGGRGRGRGRGGSAPRRFSGRNGQEDQGEEGTTEQNPADGAQAVESNEADGTPRRGRRPYRARGGRGGSRPEEGLATEQGEATGAIQTGHRGRRRNRRSSTKGENGLGNGAGAEPVGSSKTTVFVANLPFAMDDEGLKALFKDYQVAAAHVVKRKTGRSKGFGFVDLANEEEQKKVLQNLTNVQADGREIVIKVSVSDLAEAKEAAADDEQ